jgi:Mg/Co/Ni transporter MgtE
MSLLKQNGAPQCTPVTAKPTQLRQAAREDLCRRERVRTAGWETCFVTDARGVVHGRLGRSALAANDDVSVEEAMTLGPSTVRPSLELDKAVERMRKQNLTTLPVTRSDGVLVGVLRRDDAERGLPSLPAR